MKKTRNHFVVTRFNEDINWIKNYTNNYTIYNKGINDLDDPNVIVSKNIGGNQYDIFRYCYENYDDLPKTIVFLQGNPFDQCPLNVFNRLVYNKIFTPLEWFTHNIRSDGGYSEINSMYWNCKFVTVDNFMNYYFSNYKHFHRIDFPPGSQFVVPKEFILKYPQKFWKSVMNDFTIEEDKLPHLIERTLMMIFRDNLQVRKEFYD